VVPSVDYCLLEGPMLVPGNTNETGVGHAFSESSEADRCAACAKQNHFAGLWKPSVALSHFFLYIMGKVMTVMRLGVLDLVS
jgi:hypothetical protein